VYDTHLHVPLWVHHPTRAPETVDDVVSARDLFGLIRNAALEGCPSETILDSGYRERHPVAVAEHFYYPHTKNMAPRYRQNLASAVSRRKKVILRREGVELYDLEKDPGELRPQCGSLEDFAEVSRRGGVERAAIESTVVRLRRWAAEQAGRSGHPHRVGADRPTPTDAVSSAEALSEPSPQSSPAGSAREEPLALRAI
jgi:hypothetical protein